LDYDVHDPYTDAFYKAHAAQWAGPPADEYYTAGAKEYKLVEV
jgi:hypothetical protein